MIYQAIVFVRRHSAYGVGHVGWAFLLNARLFNTGAVENHKGGLFTPSAGMGFWMVHAADPIVPMRKKRYNEFKVIDVDQGDPQTATGVVHWVSRQAYEAIGRNCMDDTYDVLRAYGVEKLPPPARHWIPNYWFDMLGGTHFRIQNKGIIRLAGSGQPAISGGLLQDGASLHLATYPKPSPIKPVWRDLTTADSNHLQTSIQTAPPMPIIHKRYGPKPLLLFWFHFLQWLGLK